MAKLLLLNGPNLNLLGQREPQIYGNATLDSIEEALIKAAKDAGHSLQAMQSNSESQLIETIHQAAKQQVKYIIINPAAFSHTSIALRDAFAAVDIPFIEVHISNVYQREDFRQHSYLSAIASGVITGLGINGYHLALTHIIQELTER